MPSRNITKQFEAEAYYHVYNRGVEKRRIFLDDNDYVVFLGLIKKYLLGKSLPSTNRHSYDNLSGHIELLAYCLMPNHYHLLFYQIERDALTRLMRRVITAYVMYFNHRYERVGGLFQSRYKASHITTDAYLYHISRYIHMNPSEPMAWPYSSLSCYVRKRKVEWLNPSRILFLFDDNRQAYDDFIADYTENKAELDALKRQLANGAELM